MSLSNPSYLSWAQFSIFPLSILDLYFCSVKYRFFLFLHAVAINWAAEWIKILIWWNVWAFLEIQINFPICLFASGGTWKGQGTERFDVYAELINHLFSYNLSSAIYRCLVISQRLCVYVCVYIMNAPIMWKKIKTYRINVSVQS